MTDDMTGTLIDLAARPGADRAIVIGAGMGGLLAARALADRFAEVVVLDRDTLPGAPVQRKNVPQGHHVHALLAQGRTVIERLFPGITAELVADGAIDAGVDDVTWFQQGGYHRRPAGDMRALLLSRPLLEFHARRRVAALPNVTIVDQCQATGLLRSADGAAIAGLRAAPAAAGDERELGAALVVDASGRGSRLPAWLEALGFAAPEEEATGIDVRYATRRFRRSPATDPTPPVTVIVGSPALRRGGVMMAQEGDRWLVTLSGRGGIQPPTELGAFIAYAGSLEAPDIFEGVRDAEPLDDGLIYRIPRSQRRHYARLERLPDGVLPFADAICAFNPIYGQGMTVAAIEAEALARCLAEGDTSLTPRVFTAIAGPLDAAWKMAAAGDLRYATDRVELPLPARLVNQYMARLLIAAQRDPVVSGAFHRVMHLVDMPSALMRPSVASRVALATLRPAPHALTAPGSPTPVLTPGARS